METRTDGSALVKNMSAEERASLLAQLQAEEQNSRQQRRATYEALRASFMAEVAHRATSIATLVAGFKQWLDGETEGFTAVMHEYGQTKNDGQMSYTITDGDFRLEVKFNKVKGFDERADMAAERLVDYLRRYMEKSDKGTEDPMYQMAMTLLERNKTGDLDYKSISKLYELEDRFDAEYAEIMRLFKEANVVQHTATNYYFSERNAENGVWRRIEPSFCRL